MVLDPKNLLCEGPDHQDKDKDDQAAELRRLRRLQMMVGMVLSVLRQNPDLTPVSARALMANCRSAALAMFPGKELAFDLIYQPRLERALQERFGVR